MTINIAYAATSDGYLGSYSSSYSTARTGPAGAVDTSATFAFHGQRLLSGTYGLFQTFIGFTYSAVPATEMVTSAYIRVYSETQSATGVARDLELRGYAWSAGGLTGSDWRTPTQLSALRLDGVVKNVQGSVSKFALAASDQIVPAMSTVTSFEQVIATSRQRAGNTPTADETSSIISAEESGTTYDPALVWTTVTRTTLVPALQASVQLSDGTFAEIVGTGAAGGALTLRHYTSGGVVWNATLPSDFDLTVRGAQGVALAADGQDNLYVIGKSAGANNSLAVRAYVKSVGAWSWTAGTVRTVALPTYDGPVNNVSAVYHGTAGGTLFVATGHMAGNGVSGGTGNELSYALLSTAYLLAGTGSLVRGSGSLLGGILPALAPQDFNNFGNDTGTGLEVTADLVQQDWGYVLCYRKDQRLGENTDLYLGRYVLNSGGTGFLHTSSQPGAGYGTKDANSKVRLLAVGDGQVVAITADGDAGWGLTVSAMQAQGLSSGFVNLGSTILAGVTANMPDGPAIGAATWWDAVYSLADNSVWVYYRSSTDSTKVLRTQVSLDTYQRTSTEVQAYSGTTVVGVRAPKNAVVAGSTRIQVATYAASTHGLTEVVDPFNVAPTAPVLTPKTNFDATAATTFEWTFTDPNAGDTQSAYDLEIQRTDTSTTVVATGKTASTASQRAITGGTLTNGLSYRWRVRTWDAADLVGPWSDYGTFSTSAGGTVTITDPVTDNPTNLVTDEVQVTWSVTGTTQADYRVILKRNDTNGTVSDTGWVTSTATQLLVSGMVTGVEHTVQVQVRNASAVVSGIGSRLLTPNYGTPEAPQVTVSPVPEQGYVLVSIVNPFSGQPELGTAENTFESGTGAWMGTGGTAAASTDRAYAGTQSLKLTTVGAVTQTYARDYTNAVAVTPTERYTARMWVWTATARTLTASIDWLGAAGAYLSTTAADTAVPASTWTEIQVTGTAPDGALTAGYGPTVGGSPANGTVIYADNILLTAASDRPEVSRNQILRRRADIGGTWTVLGDTEPDGSFRDYSAPGGVPLEYVARGIAD